MAYMGQESKQEWMYVYAELFKILKDDAVKVPRSIYHQIWTTQQWL